MKQELARILTAALAQYIDNNREGGMCMSNIECEKMEQSFMRGDFDQVDIFLKKKIAKSEDEWIRRGLIEVFSRSNPNDTWSDTGITMKEIITYLKKQKEQKPKWTEEDEMYRNGIIRNLEFLINRADNSIGLKDELQTRLEWFKALRPHWKPSEEQMVALDEYIYEKYPDTEKYSKAVLSLRDDLMKL